MFTKIRLILIAAAMGVVLAGPGVASAATTPDAKRFHGIGEQTKRFHGMEPAGGRLYGVQPAGGRLYGVQPDLKRFLP